MDTLETSHETESNAGISRYTRSEERATGDALSESGFPGFLIKKNGNTAIKCVPLRLQKNLKWESRNNPSFYLFFVGEINVTQFSFQAFFFFGNMKEKGEPPNWNQRDTNG